MWTVPELFIFSMKEGLEGDAWLRKRRRRGRRKRRRRRRKLSGSQRVLDAKGCCPPPATCREEECEWGGRVREKTECGWGTGEATETLTFDWASEMGGL